MNALSLTHPGLVKEWHPTRNEQVTPDDVVAGSERQAWWVCPAGHEYQTKVVSRTSGHNCHYCTRQKADPQHTSLAATHPRIAAMWHPTRNGELTPEQVMPGSPKKVWWRCANGHEYDGAIVSRVKGVGCRYCSNRARSATNIMSVARPDLAAEWHPTRNGDLTPGHVVPGTSKRIWWRCAAGHDWQVSGDNRVRQNTGCPVCSNKKVLAGANDMATTHPALAAEWHPTRNGALSPQQVVAGTARKIWWRCANGHEWRSSGDNRVTHGRGCSKCGPADHPVHV
ncbi:zinc-ribbon domain-containing protein [Agromyces sp. NPDC058104]|uniref:zinc-ribbon domain-containing protein n=1 Tax=Agromyces sp. NPDC058104 TaxID=3346342 RepID=UPI0036DA82A5